MELALDHIRGCRRRKQAEAAQNGSRRIASLMFVKCAAGRHGRDRLGRSSIGSSAFVGEIEKSLRQADLTEAQSNTTTPRATSPAIMRLKPSLMSASL